MKNQTYWLATNGDGTVYKYDQKPECEIALGGWFPKVGANPGVHFATTSSHNWSTSIVQVN